MRSNDGWLRTLCSRIVIGLPSTPTREANECSEWAEFGRELRERLNEAEASPDDMEALIAVGELYRSARRYKTGLVWLRRALALDPSNERARSAVADTLAEQGSTDEGERR